MSGIPEAQVVEELREAMAQAWDEGRTARTGEVNPYRSGPQRVHMPKHEARQPHPDTQIGRLNG